MRRGSALLARGIAFACDWSLSHVRAILSSFAGNGQLGVCAVCGAAVVDGEPYLRYRGEYYHAHGCLESGLPALESLASK
jgi:hypothetical protein